MAWQDLIATPSLRPNPAITHRILLRKAPFTHCDPRRVMPQAAMERPTYGRSNKWGGSGSLPNQWPRILSDPELPSFTACILRHSFASLANDLGFTESTIAALVGHSAGLITSKHIHALDTVLIMAVGTIAGYIKGLLDGVEFNQAACAFDRASRKAALGQFIQEAAQTPV